MSTRRTGGEGLPEALGFVAIAILAAAIALQLLGPSSPVADTATGPLTAYGTILGYGIPVALAVVGGLYLLARGATRAR